MGGRFFPPRIAALPNIEGPERSPARMAGRLGGQAPKRQAQFPRRHALAQAVGSPLAGRSSGETYPGF